MLGATDNNVRRNTNATQLVDGVLGGFRLEFARSRDHRHQCDVDVADILFADLVAQLSNRLKEWQALNVANRPANLDEHDVDRLGLGHTQHATFDLVGDVRDHLHGRAEVLAPAFAADHTIVDRTRGGI